jgi:hypothetical protein
MRKGFFPFCLLFSLLISLLAMATSAWAKPPHHSKMTARAQRARASMPKVVRLEATPASVRLAGPLATQRLLVTAVLADGSRRDVTDAAIFTSVAPRIVLVSRSGEVAAKADGQAAVTAKWGGKTVRILVVADGVHRPVVFSFVDDVVPILSRMGCSQGTCHGAAQGKGGFRLSLRGYAPEIDFISITRQLGGRRISREAPENSLFLRKPLGEVPYRGGKRFEKGARAYAVLLGWLKEGAPGPTGKEAPLTQLEILPGDRQMRPHEQQRLLARATFADGRTEDVTGRALYNTNDSPSPK